MDDKQSRRIALTVAAAFFMETLDGSIITTALPAIGASFDQSALGVSVSVTSYLIAMAVFVPAAGWCGDRFGARRVFAAAITVFTGASLLCALSQGLAGFTAARTLQGIGGAMMVPIGRLVVLRDTPKDALVRTIAILTWPALVAPILGPPLGGWISTHWSWHWIFLPNLPLGTAAFVAALWLIRDGEHRTDGFDLPGFVLSGLGFALFMGGIELASRNDIALAWSLAALAAGLVYRAVRTALSAGSRRQP